MTGFHTYNPCCSSYTYINVEGLGNGTRLLQLQPVFNFHFLIIKLKYLDRYLELTISGPSDLSVLST